MANTNTTNMANFVIIEKLGNCVDKNVKNFKLDDLYKKCNLRKSEGFGKVHSFKIKNYYITVFARSNGASSTINKFELPPPIDNTLYYGNIALIKSTSQDVENTMLDYDVEKWNKDYETLMGGFEDINTNSEDDYESDELDKYPKEQLTKDGYLKDDFIVDEADNGNDDENYIEESTCDSDDDSDDGYETSGTQYDSDETDSELSEEEYDSE